MIRIYCFTKKSSLPESFCHLHCFHSWAVSHSFSSVSQNDRQMTKPRDAPTPGEHQQHHPTALVEAATLWAGICPLSHPCCWLRRASVPWAPALSWSPGFGAADGAGAVTWCSSDASSPGSPAAPADANPTLFIAHLHGNQPSQLMTAA